MANDDYIQKIPERYNLKGKRFGRLTVLRFAFVRKNRRYWHCLCDCGNETDIVYYSLVHNTRSCGCLHREVTSKVKRTHGMTRTPTYYTWCAMRERCSNKNHQNYKHYGGRGISVCKRWDMFENFFADMGKRPSRKHSIERIDNDGDYEPDNCYWATRKEQVVNKRNNRMLTHDGITLTMSEWARRTGISKGTLFARLKAGWSDERALTTPVRSYS